jgi:uncharacterized protein YndB with AHSA1/START domain
MIMASATLTPDQASVVAEMFIAAPPARVFQAITDPKQTAQWWGQKGLYRLSATHADVRVGGKWFSEGVSDAGERFRVEGEYLEIEPPRLLVHTWNPSYHKLAGTIVRWELEPRAVHGLHQQRPHPVGTGTLVRVTHSGFAGKVEACKAHGDGWVRVLGWMQAFIERGETIVTRG